MRRLVAIFLLVAVAVLPQAGAVAQPAEKPATEAALIEAAGFAAADVGYLVVDLADGKVVAAHNPDEPFVPASVAKIASIAPALAILGAEHRFETTVAAVGEVADGVLTGTLVLRGGGNPFLSGDDLRALARELAASGVKRVEGAFLYDASGLIDVPAINPTQPEAAGYNPGVSALSLNFNRVRVDWMAGKGGRTAKASAVSDQLTLPVDSIGLAFSDSDLAGPFVRTGGPGSEDWLLSPALGDKGEAWLPVGSSALITAEVFRALAAAEGIDLPEPAAGVTPDGARVLARNQSPPLAEIAAAVLRYSNNLSAELVGLAASSKLTGRKLSLLESAAALAAWWQLRVPDADWTGLFLENHSGLSSRSLATPRQFVVMLEEAAGPLGGADFHALLRPISWKGVKGSARVKTGTMSYIRGLAGYLDTASGRRLAFAIFFNDDDKRAALDARFDPQVREIDPASRPWRDRALKLEETLTSAWAGDN